MLLHDWAVLRENLGSGLKNSHPHLLSPRRSHAGQASLKLVSQPRDPSSMDSIVETSETPSLSSILVDQAWDFAGSFSKDTFKTMSMSE